MQTEQVAPSTSTIESWLNGRDVKFTFEPAAPLDQFNQKASQDNQARFNPLDEVTVLRYAEAMERGETFPPTVSYRASDGKLVQIDGNHRLQASDLVGKKNLPTYIVQTTPETIRLLTFEANSRHGLNPSQEERERHAIFLLDNDIPAKEVRRITGLSKGLVARAWKLEKASRRARRLGLRGWSTIQRNSQNRIASIANDNVFSEFVRIAARRNLLVNEVSRIARDLRNLSTEREQISFLKEFDKTVELEPKKGRNGPNQTSPRHQAKMHLSYVGQMDLDGICNCVLTVDQRDELVQKIDSALKILNSLRNRVDEVSVQR